MKGFKQRRAFTIVEMVIVIAVIAVLATVMIPTVSGVINKANVSADQQLAASINKQLAVWEADPNNGAIDSEAKLKKAIAEYYGDGFYNSLQPQSGEQGYNYWYNATDKQFVLAKADELMTLSEGWEDSRATQDFVVLPEVILLEDGTTMPVADASNPYDLCHFERNSLRSLMIKTKDGGWKNFFLVDQGGSDLGRIVSSFDYFDQGVNQYETVMHNLNNLVTAGNGVSKALKEKISKTAVVNNQGAFRSGNKDEIEFVYVSPQTGTLANTKTFIYDENKPENQKVSDATYEEIASGNVKEIHVPATVVVDYLGLNALSSSADKQNYTGQTKLVIPVQTLAELEAMFTPLVINTVVELPNGTQYLVENGGIYELPLQRDAGQNIVSTPVATPKAEVTLSGINFTMKCEGAATEPKTSKIYMSGSDLYIAYDWYNAGNANTLQLSVDGFSADQLDWMVSGVNAETPEISVSKTQGSKTASLKLNSNKVGNYKIKASLANTDCMGEINVFVVGPRLVDFTVGGTALTYDEYLKNPNTPITVTYKGPNARTFEIVATNTGVDGNVVKFDNALPENVVFSTASNELFTVAPETVDGKTTWTLVLNELKNGQTQYTGTQNLTVTLGGLTFDVVISVNNQAASPFVLNTVAGVEIGSSYLFRVGNLNGFTLGNLFNATETNKKIDGDIRVDIYDLIYVPENDSLIYTTSTDATTKTNMSVSVSSGATWDATTINFNKTRGVAKIVLSDKYGRSESVLIEVVDGTNITSMSNWTNSGNRVLLSNLTMDKTFSVDSNTYLWGNGYTLDMQSIGETKNGANAEIGLITVNGTMDNVRVEGPVFTEYGGSYRDKYSVSTVVSGQGSTIANCYISNGRAPVRVGGDAVLDNTTLVGGRYASLDIRAGHVTLRNITTVNQPARTAGTDKNDPANVFGLGIVVYIDAPADTTSVTLEGILIQHNYVKQDDKDYLPDGDVKNMFDTVFSFNKFKHSNKNFDNGDIYVNTGIVLMNGDDDLKGAIPDNYSSDKKTMSAYGKTATGFVYTLDSSKYTSFDGSELNYSGWEPSGQYVITPDFSFDHSKNKNPDGASENDFVRADTATNEVTISMDLGDTYNWDPMILTGTKLYNNLTYTVTLMKDGVSQGNYTNKMISFDTAGEYVVKYECIDTYNYILSGKSLIKKDVTYTKYVTITVLTVKADAKPAQFDFNLSTDGNQYKRVEIGDKTYYVMPEATATSSTIGMKTISGVNVYYPIVEAYNKSDGGWDGKNSGSWNAYFPVFWKVVTITDYADGGTGSAVTYNESTEELPAGLSVKDPTTTFRYGMDPLAPDEPIFWNNHLAYKCADGLTNGNERAETTIVAEYTYIDNAGNTYKYFVGYHCKAHEKSCITPDTMITLADGTQVRVDSLTGSELLLVWNMETGKLDSAPIMFVDSDPTAEYEVIKLYFSDGTEVKVISEHGFWDYDLNKYVYLDENAADYIGHWFAKQNGDALEKVQLVDVVIETEMTEAWSPVTAGHLCYFVNGMLSMPGGVGGLFNIFDVDAETMTYDYEALARDIETYGLFTYEEMNAIVPLSENMFNMAGGAYLKISIGKGNMTMDDLAYMINRYSVYFN